jgi:hypothetical protein
MKMNKIWIYVFFQHLISYFTIFVFLKLNVLKILKMIETID